MDIGHDIRHFANRASQFGERIAHQGGHLLHQAVDGLGDAAGGAVAGAGGLAAHGLERMGADNFAARLRGGSEQAGERVDNAIDWMGKQVGGVVAGLATSLATMPANLAQIATDPVGTAKDLVSIARNPRVIVDFYHDRAEEKGVAFTLGEGAMDLLGPGKILGLSKVVKLGKAASLARLGGTAEDISGISQMAPAPRMASSEHDGFLLMG